MALPSAKTRRLIVLGILALAVGLLATAILVYVDNPSTTDLPVAIQYVEPEPRSNVLRQSDVVVDLAVGYTAEIDINGVPIPEPQISRAEALNRLTYEPRAGKAVPTLFPDQNCVRVNYWLIVSGPEDAKTYTWCFDAS